MVEKEVREPTDAKPSSTKPSGKFIIEIMNGPEDGRTVECDVSPITIGRASDNLIHLPYDHLISRYHAKIELKENRLILHDLDSTNGTYVREQRIKDEKSIELNKMFRVGATLLTIRLRSKKK
jgi:pSer/pThr/pTyr-binding forkhead associated (FHA) protein